MPSLTEFARTAASIGDPGRAAMLWGLMDGRALTAGELATLAGVSNSTASEHLASLRQSGLVVRLINGRHHYYRLASSEAASLLERMMNLAAVTIEGDQTIRKSVRSGPADPALRRLRRCYDHLAGEIAVRIAEVMTERGQIQMSDEAALVTPKGEAFLQTMGVSLQTPSSSQDHGRTFCRPCLDWSERRHHLAGRVGALLFRAMDQSHWLCASKGGRALRLTPHGVRELERHFGICAPAT